MEVCSTSATVVQLADLIMGEDAGGTWTANSAVNAGSFDSGAGTFAPIGHLAGVYEFSYIVQGLLPCTNDTSTVLLTINVCECLPPLTPITLAANVVSCVGELNTTPFVPVTVLGVTYNWYNAPVGGTLLGTGPTFTAQAPVTYYAEAVTTCDPTCVSQGRLAFVLLQDQVSISAPYLLTTMPDDSN